MAMAQQGILVHGVDASADVVDQDVHALRRTICSSRWLTHSYQQVGFNLQSFYLDFASFSTVNREASKPYYLVTSMRLKSNMKSRASTGHYLLNIFISLSHIF